MIVIDTSALVAFLVDGGELGEKVRSTVAEEQLAAPHAVDLECAATLRGLARGKKLPAQEAERALDLLSIMQIQRYDHIGLLRRVWQLRENMWPYDAAYVALAESLSCALVTLDGKFARTPGIGCTIHNLRGS